MSQASRIACIGPNGAGKSTLIKVLVGETKPDEGCPEVYRHQNCRIAYVAQHAFHHIEQHLEMSPVEYIQWRFSGGLDKEQQAMEAAQMSEEEKAQLKQPFIVYLKELAAELDEAGNATGEREIIFEKMEPLKKGQKPPPVDPVNGIFPNCVRTIKQLIGRRTRHGDYEYEVKWGDKEMVSMDPKNNLYVPKVVLETHGFHKLMKAIDDKIAAEAGNVKPLTTTAIQRHLDDFGLHEEFGTYVPRPRPFSQLRGAMDSVSDFESGGCGFESRRSCRRSRGAKRVSTVRSPRRRRVRGRREPRQRLGRDVESRGLRRHHHLLRHVPSSGLLAGSVGERPRRHRTERRDGIVRPRGLAGRCG